MGLPGSISSISHNCLMVAWLVCVRRGALQLHHLIVGHEQGGSDGNIEASGVETIHRFVQ